MTDRGHRQAMFPERAELIEALRAARVEVEDLETRLEDARRTRDRVIRRALTRRWTLRDVAINAGVSHTAVAAIRRSDPPKDRHAECGEACRIWRNPEG